MQPDTEETEKPKLEEGTLMERIDRDELSWKDKIAYDKFKKKIQKGLPKLVEGYNAIQDGLNQVRNLKNKTEEERKNLEEDIRQDIIKALVKSMDILVITDRKLNEDTGQYEDVEETELTLQVKTTDQLIVLLKENIEELEVFVLGKKQEDKKG